MTLVPETWTITGDARTEQSGGGAETALTFAGYPLTSHVLNLPGSTWTGSQIAEILRTAEACGCTIKYVKAGTPNSAETFAIVGNARTEVENTLAAAGYPVSSHQITLPSSSWSHTQLKEILRIVKAGGCRLTYTKAS